MYTLKSIATRGTALGAAFALVAAAVVPGAVALASELNPLTERSLLLSSSAPGYVDTDGSNYSTGSPNPAAGGGIPGTYAPAGTGPNGKKTGETFKFNVSSGTNIKGLSFQYCTKAAGLCQAPGNNTGDARTPTPDDRQDNDGVGGGWESQTSDLNVVGTFDEADDYDADGLAAGEFAVLVEGQQSNGWAMTATNLEDDAYSDGVNSALTGKNNYVTLVNAGGPTPAAGDNVQIIFKASESVFITNPGDGEFFVKINTYSSNTSLIGEHNDPDGDPEDDSTHTVIDGGVTVANMMTDSIHITTKVLETMDFSVGIHNKDADDVTHGICDPIEVQNNNRLDLGNPSAENSLSTSTAYDTNSFWRLSSNSSGGATVYYSGTTLSNTVGDDIDAMGATRQHSQIGKEQFGLALVDPNVGFGAPHSEGTNGNGTRDFPTSWEAPSYDPLVVETAYAGGDLASISNPDAAQNAEFAFVGTSIDTPEVIAQDDNTVVKCATGKVRYVANIAANTPAGVYTTRINYLAAPQY